MLRKLKITFDIVGSDTSEVNVTGSSEDIVDYMLSIKKSIFDNRDFVVIGDGLQSTIIRKDKIKRIIFKEEK